MEAGRLVAAVLLTMGCISLLSFTINKRSGEYVREDAVLAEALLEAKVTEHDPAVVEARALKAVTRTKRAALALQTVRQAVVRLEKLGDAQGTAAALKAEQSAKTTFLKAREVSTPLVAEARANYEATQGTEIQKVAREVAQDTWRSMTGSPLKPGHASTVQEEEGLRYGTLKSQIRRAAIEKVKRKIANDYREQAHRAQMNAIAAQRKIDSLPAGSETHVAAIAKYAESAKKSLAATNAAKENAEAANARILKAETDEKKKKLKEKSVPKASKTAEETIAQAESDVAASMQTVEDAANERGMADTSWHTRIGGMVKSGQPQAANEAAQKYVEKRLAKAMSKETINDPTVQAANEVAKAGKVIDAAAARHTRL